MPHLSEVDFAKLPADVRAGCQIGTSIDETPSASGTEGKKAVNGPSSGRSGVRAQARGLGECLPRLPQGKKAKRPKRIKGKDIKAGQRSLKYLRDRGWTCGIVEHYQSNFAGAGQKARFAGGYRVDLFGFVDIVCYRPDPIDMDGKSVSVLFVQATSRQQIAPHLRAYRQSEVYVKRGSPEQAEKKRAEHRELIERMRRMIDAPGAVFVIHGWECVEAPTKAGGIKPAWRVEERIVRLEDILKIP